MSILNSTNIQDDAVKNNDRWHGLMPAPQLIKAYKEIGSGEILDWWKKLVEIERDQYNQETEKAYELEHKKLDLQKEKLKLQADEAKRGQIFGLGNRS